MAEDIKDIADLLGAKIIGEVPDVGGGAFAAVHLAKIYQARMEELRKQLPGRPVEGTSVRLLEVPISEASARILLAMAEHVALPESQPNPAHFAADLLESFVAALLESAVKFLLEDFQKLKTDLTRVQEKSADVKALVEVVEKAKGKALHRLIGVLTDRKAAG